MRLDAKQQIAEDLHERFARSAIIVLTDYKGLDVTAMNDLQWLKLLLDCLKTDLEPFRVRAETEC